jgi:hypothetical protein
MRAVVVLAIVLSASACAEVVQGPRYVAYTPERFYIRHAPVTTSNDGAARLAAGICREQGKTAQLDTQEQYYPYDLRVAVFNCVGG